MKELERNPDTYLKMIEAEGQRERKGKLKIFFGYAAGVGKTYAMLSAAQRERRMGTDIVAGYIEPHEREETAKRAKGLEVIPPKEMQIDKILVKEMDIDAVLKRKPQVVLVDEMAHTNADGSRHPKRYQDIEEILKAGIDVYTTLNVQHIESVHDTVASITGVAVRERVPDMIFDRAVQIEMIDIPPEELLMRLKSGKVYKEERVQQALKNFFSIENLTALREIALRRMADWVNREQDVMLLGEKGGNASEHIMMCLSSSPSNAKVIRQAARMAKAFHGKFTAFYVETSEYSQMEAEDVRRLRENRKLAEKFGAKIVTSFGNDIVEQIAEYAKVARVTKIVLGRSYTKHTLFTRKESMSERLSSLVPKLEIFLIPDSYEKEYVKKKQQKRKKRFDAIRVLGDTGICIGILGLVTGAGILFARYGFSETNIVMLYVLGALLVALLSRHRITGILYGIAAIVLFDLLFTAPKLTLGVTDAGYTVTFFVIFVVSLIISTLVKKVKSIAKLNVEKAYRMSILLDTSRILQQDKTKEEIGRHTAEQLGTLLNRSVCCFIGNPEEILHPIIYQIPGKELELPEQERAVAAWSYKNNKSAGAGTSTLPGAKNLFLTIRNGEKIFGMVGIAMQGKDLSAFEESMMLSILNESALAFEKEEGVAKEREMAVRLEQEQLRANLLRSISHDFRTPLTGIFGNADMLLNEGWHMTEKQKESIYSDIYDDAEWLMNLVENLLSVTRIENGTMKLNTQPELLDDVIEEALSHIGRKGDSHPIKYSLLEDIIVVKMDVKLITQVLINLVDNAMKYTPEGSQIEIRAMRREDRVRVEVRDNGPGIEEEQREKIFNMFYTAGNKDTDGRRGMGLGLALCKSIIEAHGGEIWEEDNEPHGAVFIFELKAELAV